MNLSVSHKFLHRQSRVYALAIHPVGHTTVSGDRVSKVLDVECALEARGKEATEWRDERSERGHYQTVDLEGRVLDRRCCSAKLVVSLFRPDWSLLGELTVDSKRCRTGAANGSSRHTNTGLGLHETLENALAPRSRAGQIM